MQVEECVVLSAPLLQRRGLLRGGASVCGTVSFSHGDEAPFATFGLEVRTGETEGELKPIRPGAAWGMHRVLLVTTPLPWGRLRWWFLCPMRRHSGPGMAAKLYLPPGRDTFGCRRCWDLSYASRQASHRPGRLLAATERLRRRLAK